MRVKTKTSITINTDMVNTRDEILYMDINHYVYSNDFNKLEVDGEYYYEIGSPANRVILKNFCYILDGAEIDNLYNSLPSVTETDKHLIDREIAYNAGLKVMSLEYSISEANLEIEA